MENNLPESVKMVKQFHDLFEHPVGRILGQESLKIRQLRIKLLFEELAELAEAGDVKATMLALSITYINSLGRPEDKLTKQELEELIQESCTEQQVFDGDKVDIVEEADAIADLQYVLDGKKLTSGLYPYMDAIFERVHKNNMSKAHRDEAHCMATIEANGGDLILDPAGKPGDGGWHISERGGLFFLYNPDGKLTKPHDHVKVSIAPLLP